MHFQFLVLLSAEYEVDLTALWTDRFWLRLSSPSYIGQFILGLCVSLKYWFSRYSTLTCSNQFTHCSVKEHHSSWTTLACALIWFVLINFGHFAPSHYQVAALYFDGSFMENCSEYTPPPPFPLGQKRKEKDARNFLSEPSSIRLKF